MSPAEDLTEGYFRLFRSARGSRSGFYRGARLYLTEDFKMHGRKAGGMVRLRARGKSVYLQPENGYSVWKQQADGTWELLNPHEEVIARQGTIYRNDGRSFFFEVRAK